MGGLGAAGTGFSTGNAPVGFIDVAMPNATSSPFFVRCNDGRTASCIVNRTGASVAITAEPTTVDKNARTKLVRLYPSLPVR